jgi:quinol monooxygenase YgiN
MGDTAVIVTSTAQPGRREEIRAVYDEMMAPRAVANDAQEIVVWCDDLHDADTFHLFEIYRDAESMGANAQAPWFAEYLARVGPLMAGEPRMAMATPRWSKGLS